MIKSFLKMFSVILLSNGLVACGSGGSGTSPRAEDKINRQALRPDGSVWLVTQKFCNSTPVGLMGVEKLQFVSGVVSYLYQASENDSEICDEAQIFTRNIQSQSFDPEVYKEGSVLSPSAVRVVCKDKQTGVATLETTRNTSGATRTLSLNLSTESGTAELSAAAGCMGQVHFILRKSQ